MPRRNFDMREIRDDPDRDVCDFCLSPNVRWTFPCRDFTTHDDLSIVSQQSDGSLSVDTEHIEYNAYGDWAACPACHALIVRGDRERLAVRSVKHAFRRHPEVAKVFVFEDYLAHVRMRQDKFWANRLGKPIPADHPLTERGER